VNNLYLFIKKIYKIFHKINELELTINKQAIYLFLFFFKKHTLTQCSTCIDILITDIPSKFYRFTCIYYITSPVYNKRYKIKTQINEIFPLSSVISIYPSCTWCEREIWDLFGIFFIYHKQLRRILTDYGFISHPLRKDFPLSGFYEINFKDTAKQITKSSVRLNQAMKYY
jgi:NADH:ubiquinone oxidoreductase subunit C